METVGVRELRQRASALLRRVARGEVLGITDRGRLIAVLAPPSAATGAGALVAAGRVRPARADARSLPAPTAAERTIEEVLAELRADA
jgi:prevent-host-death family protein